MASQLQLEIVTPDRVVLSETVDYVAVPGIEGEFGVLPGHTPFLSALKVGCLHYKAKGETCYVCVTGGFAEVTESKVLILADAGEMAEDIDRERAEKARQRALERLEKAKREESINITRAEASLHRAINRLNAKNLIG